MKNNDNCILKNEAYDFLFGGPVKKKKKIKPSNKTNNLKTNIVVPKDNSPPDINKIKASLEKYKVKANNDDNNKINNNNQFINKKRNNENKMENKDRNENYKIKKINGGEKNLHKSSYSPTKNNFTNKKSNSNENNNYNSPENKNKKKQNSFSNKSIDKSDIKHNINHNNNNINNNLNKSTNNIKQKSSSDFHKNSNQKEKIREHHSSNHYNSSSKKDNNHHNKERIRENNHNYNHSQNHSHTFDKKEKEKKRNNGLIPIQRSNSKDNKESRLDRQKTPGPEHKKIINKNKYNYDKEKSNHLSLHSNSNLKNKGSNMKNHGHIEKNNNDTIRLSSRNNLPEASDKLKKLLEERRIGSDGKRIHNNMENKNNMKEKKKDYKKNYDNSSDYDDMDGFIDDGEEESMNSEVKDFFIDMDKKHKIQKKHEYKGDIIESNYDYIQQEEKYSRFIGRKEDEEAAKYNKEHEDEDEDDDDEDEEY